jgi:acyl carrier protein
MNPRERQSSVASVLSLSARFRAWRSIKRIEVDIENCIRKYLGNAFRLSHTARIPDDESLVTNGHVDSAGMLQIIMFLENEFGIVIDDTELTPENLETIGRMAVFVRRKWPADAA